MIHKIRRCKYIFFNIWLECIHSIKYDSTVCIWHRCNISQHSRCKFMKHTW